MEHFSRELQWFRLFRDIYESLKNTMQSKYVSMDHVIDLQVDSSLGIKLADSGSHRAKFAPGLSSVLLQLADSNDVGDPMAGTGMLAWETNGINMALNDIDPNMGRFLMPLANRNEVTFKPAAEVDWKREVCIFSPPYYPKADRCKPAAHNDAKRGPVVGFRDSYSGEHPEFIGNPGGVDAIKIYREQMTKIYEHLLSICERMIVVTKNWTRLGHEMRLDLDTILMAESVGWSCEKRHGWMPPQSLWSRFNAQRGGGSLVEDVPDIREVI